MCACARVLVVEVSQSECVAICVQELIYVDMVQCNEGRQAVLASSCNLHLW